MEAVSRRSSVWMSRCGHGRVVLVICLCIATLLLQSTISAASHVGYGTSMKAELFHRDHPSSRLQSTIPLSYAEKLENDVKRSADRARALVNKRRVLAGQSSVAAANGSTTLQTTLNDAAVAEYVMSISLGTPPQKFVAVADTASDLTWLQCKPCQSCFAQPDPFFDPALSSTYRSLNCSSTGCSSFISQYGASVPSCAFGGGKCQYSYLYGDMSNTTGTFSSDTLTLPSKSGENVSVPHFWFGCSYASFSPSALFDSTDGMIGLGQGLISFPSQLGNFFEDKFSYCLVNRSLAVVQSSLLLFGTDAVPDLDLQYTPIRCNDLYPYYYYITLKGISVAGTDVNCNWTAIDIDPAGFGGTIIDSGTTFTSLDPTAFTPLLATIESQFPSSYERVFLPAGLSYFELCYDVTAQPNFGNDLPPISLRFANNTSWDLAPENAWLLFPDTPVVGNFTICLSILRGLPGEFSIIGSTQQQDFHVLYDRVHKRIGFTKTDCGSLSP